VAPFFCRSSLKPHARSLYNDFASVYVYRVYVAMTRELVSSYHFAM
jgi:hypothetical protein